MYDKKSLKPNFYSFFFLDAKESRLYLFAKKSTRSTLTSQQKHYFYLKLLRHNFHVHFNIVADEHVFENIVFQSEMFSVERKLCRC